MSFTFIQISSRCIYAARTRDSSSGDLQTIYVFESFEISPTIEAVIGTRGRLRRCFPGPAVAIGLDRIADASFLKPLTESLVKLDAETPEEVLPIVTKAHSKVVETRDTAHPRFVTEMLTGMLRAIGQSFEVPRIYKHTRDDVLWKDALKPWRRCPLWLFLRVALQTSLMRNDVEEPHVRYKSFMLFSMAHVLEGALDASLPSGTLFLMTAKISRRALKLEAADATAWMQQVETTTGAVQQQLSRRWASLEKHPDPCVTQRDWAPSRLSFSSDTGLTLTRLRPYMAEVLARLASASTYHLYTSDCGQRISQCSSSLPDLSLLIEGNQGEVRLHLADLEFWVEHYLNEWRCKRLDNPCLRAAIPEFPPSVFEPLLLPKKPQMERLLRVEQHLATRRAAAIPGFPSMTRSIDTKGSFAVRYVQQSPRHEEIQRKIEAEAKDDRARKISELVEKRKRYHELIKQVALSKYYILYYI